MTFGQKIKKLRVDKGLTQKELADHVHVTFQTVSKWEKDENEPDFNTLRELAKLFDCSVDFLLNEKEEQEKPKVETTPAIVPTAPVENKTIIIHQKELHVCERCKKDIPEDELEIEEIVVTPYSRGHSATYRPGYYHKSCLEELRKKRQEKTDREIKEATSKAKKKIFGWSIASAVILFAFFLLVFLVGGKNDLYPALGVLYAIILGYVAFATIYCILSGSYISHVFLGVASWSVRFPGVIFTLDLEGLLFLIFVKLLFVVLGALLSVLLLILATTLSALLSTVSFPFVLINNIHSNYTDAL